MFLFISIFTCSIFMCSFVYMIFFYLSTLFCILFDFMPMLVIACPYFPSPPFKVPIRPGYAALDLTEVNEFLTRYASFERDTIRREQKAKHIYSGGQSLRNHLSKKFTDITCFYLSCFAKMLGFYLSCFEKNDEFLSVHVGSKKK